MTNRVGDLVRYCRMNLEASRVFLLFLNVVAVPYHDPNQSTTTPKDMIQMLFPRVHNPKPSCGSGILSMGVDVNP